MCGEYIPFGSFCLCSSAFSLLRLRMPPLFVHSVPRIRSLLTEFRRGSVLIFKHFFYCSLCVFCASLSPFFEDISFPGFVQSLDSAIFVRLLRRLVLRLRLAVFSFSFAFIYVRFISFSLLFSFLIPFCSVFGVLWPRILVVAPGT